MALTVVIGIVIAVCLVTTLLAYVFHNSREKLKSSSSKNTINEKQQIRYSVRPSMDIITEKLNQKFSLRNSLSSKKSNRSSTTITPCEETEEFSRKENQSTDSAKPSIRSITMAKNLLHSRRTCSASRRQISMIDQNQISAVQFTLPGQNSNAKYRRRSVATCHNIVITGEHLLTSMDCKPPSLLSFSMTYLKTCQLKIKFHSLQFLPSDMILQQLTIKVKLLPDGKDKTVQIRKLMENEVQFNDENNELTILYSNIPFDKLNEKNIFITVLGKDQMKKTVDLGHIGKVYLSHIKNFDNENQIDFLHEIQRTKPSSIELFMALEKQDNNRILVDIKRIKGLKFDQKKIDGSCYLETILLDHHRILSKYQTKFYPLKSSNFTIDEQYNFDILTYNSNNFDRLMIMFKFYSNVNSTNEYKCIAHTKLASPLLASGSGTVHWQQFKARESFAMWHKLDKEQN